MKNLLTRIIVFCTVFQCAVAKAQTAPSAGYQLAVSVNAYAHQYLYLGYHYGKIKALADSARVSSGGQAIFSGIKPLPGGIYFLVSPKKEILFEFLVDKEQHFSILADSSKPAATQFKGSTLNTDFQAYTRFTQSRGEQITNLQQSLAVAKGKEDSARTREKIRGLNAEMLNWRSNYVKKQPDNFLSTLFKTLQDPVIPPASLHPKGVYDSAFAFQYYKSHYWDGVKFSDNRLLRTPFFETKLDRYFRELVSPEPDSLKKEIDGILAKARADKDMYQFLLTHFVQAYINPQYMGQDAVFVYLFEKYINEKPEVDWFTEKYKKYMTDRAYSLMANLIGNPAWDLAMTDTSGKPASLYEVAGPYTVICFWDPTCGHCKEMVPRLDSMFQHKWKQAGIRLMGVMTEGGKENWLQYIRQNQLRDWIHVYQTEAQHEAEKNSGKPGYRQLYDVYQTPVLYLLDEQKRIIAKKLTYLQIDELISRRKTINAAKP